MKFKDLQIGEGFDWIGPDRMLNSFFKRCWRNTYRGYVDEDGIQYNDSMSGAR